MLNDDVARKHIERGIREIADQKGRLERDDRDLYLNLLSDVRDHQQREILITQFAKVYRDLSKHTIKTEVDRHRAEHAKATVKIAEAARQSSLRNMKIQPATLVGELESYFAERAHLPEGAALMLGFYALNSWTFDVFDTTPYLNVESAVPGCGKTTVLSLLRICRTPVAATGLTEATMFRVINDSRPTFLIDEAEFLEGKSDRAQMIRSIANVGYKRGARVPRCGSRENDHKVEWFDVYCPMVFAVIGGLTGTLLERSIVLHMGKKPQGVQLKRCREKILDRDAKPLREQIEAYALQARAELTRLYDFEPDEGYWPAISDREAEIWGPLLIHARVAGPEVEARLLTACASLSRQKTDIQSEEWNRALSIELRVAIEEFTGDRFMLSDLLVSLNAAENWGAKLAKYKDDDSKSRASAIGRFIQKFRLKSRQRGERGMSYLRSEALEVLSLLTAENSYRSSSLTAEDGNPVKIQPVGPEAEKTTSYSQSYSQSYSPATCEENNLLDPDAVRLQDLKDFSRVTEDTHFKKTEAGAGQSAGTVEDPGIHIGVIEL